MSHSRRATNRLRSGSNSTTYRDGLRRGSVASFVDIEGTIVWTQEYLRYRVNGCGHADAWLA